MTGNSSRHGGQYVPMKLIQTGFPRSAARSIVPPPSWGRTSDGAGSPTWNRPAAAGVDVGLGLGPLDGEAALGVELPTGVVAVAPGDRDGTGEGDGEANVAAGSGASAT